MTAWLRRRLYPWWSWLVTGWTRLAPGDRALLALAVAGLLVGMILRYRSEENGLRSAIWVWAAALLSSLKPVIDLIRQQAADTADLDAALHPYPPERIGEVDPYGTLGIESSLRERWEPGVRPPYIPREPYDQQLDAALHRHRFALLIGPPGWGKSRSAYEAIHRFDPEAQLIFPTDANVLPSVVRQQRHWRRRGIRSILWLDDLHQYFDAGSANLDSALLRRALKHEDVLVVATLPSSERSRIRAVRGIPTDAIVEPSEQLTPVEVESATLAYPQGEFSDGIGQWFCATTRLSRSYEDQQHRLGRLLVQAAVDWLRCGMETPAPLERVHTLVRGQRAEDVSDAALARELEWATSDVAGTGSALITVDQGTKGLMPAAVATAYDEGELAPEPRLIPLTTWELITEDASPEQAANIANSALLRFLRGDGQPAERQGLLAACEAAAQKAADGGSAEGLYLLGVLRTGLGQRSDSLGLLQRAADQGHAAAANDYAYMLTRQPHVIDHDRTQVREAALHYYNIAIAHGHAQAATNLATLLLEEGDLQNARDLYEQAVELGMAAARVGVAQVLWKQGQVAEAEAKAREAADAGIVPAMRLLGAWLAMRGDPEAEEWYRRAGAVGSVDALVALGHLLLRRDARSEAQTVWSRAADQNNRSAQLLLATMADEDGDRQRARALSDGVVDFFDQELQKIQRSANDDLGPLYFDIGKTSYEHGDLDEAERYFRDAAAIGHLESKFAIGVVLEERGLGNQAESAYREAAEAGHADAHARLGALLPETHQDEASRLYELAARQGGPDGQYRLGALREREGRTYDAAKWYRRAAPRHAKAAVALVDLLGAEATQQERQAADEAAYLEGYRLERQHRDVEAEEWLRRAAEHKHPSAMFELSMLLHRRGESAESRTLRAEAAELGHPAALQLQSLYRVSETEHRLPNEDTPG